MDYNPINQSDTNSKNHCLSEMLYFRLLSHPATIAILGGFWLVIAAINYPTIAGDEARWGYQARLWIHFGSPPYSGTLENKTPAIFILFALSDLLFGSQYWFPRMLGIASVVATSFVIYRLGRLWHDHWSGLIAMIVFLFPNAWWSFDGPYAAQTELFMNLFTTLAFYWIATRSKTTESRLKTCVIGGLLIGTAIAFKQIAVMSTAALCVFALDSWHQPKKKNVTFWLPIIWIGLGIILATVVSLIPMWASGVTTNDYIRGAWLLLLNPGSYANWTSRLQFYVERLKRPDTIALIASSFILWKWRGHFRIRNIPIVGLLAWIFCDALGTYASGNSYPHQMKQLLPSVALAVGLAVREAFELACASHNPSRAATSNSFLLRSRALIHQKAMELFHTEKGLTPNRPPSFTKIWNLWRENLRQVFNTIRANNISLKEALLFTFSWLLIFWMIGTPQMPAIGSAINFLIHPVVTPEQEVGGWLNAHTTENDFVYVYGTRHALYPPQLLYYSGRRSSCRHFTDHFIDAAAVPEVVGDLTVRRPPLFIVVWDNHSPDWLLNILSQHYTYSFSKARYSIYTKTT